MALTAGARLGSYEITAPVGSGGMGEVYRARDTKLHREVAIKILPEAFASDADRVARFTREAQTLASLNHPHIAQIYGFEAAALGGSADPPLHALVMELVEGEDLAQRIAHGAIPIDDALAIAKQIADALEAAHEKGIVHRDLKPANIKLTPDGAVKILDFGLAKAVDPTSAAAASAAMSPTLSLHATQAGVILGTAAYMSPEQAKGKPVDKRADIWAFGCVLYELLTGGRAFDGEDVSDILASVLKGEPAWAAVPATTPPAVQALLRRCLERDPRRRLGDMSAVRFILDEHVLLSSAPHRIDATTSGAERAGGTPVRRRRELQVHRIITGAAVVVAAAALTTAIASRRSPPAERPRVVRFVLHPLEDQLLSLARPSIAISPDGSQVVFVANGQLHLRRLADFKPQVIPATDLGQNITAPAFSPDGQWIAFHSGSERAIKRVAVTGGAALRVCDSPSSFSVVWQPSGLLVTGGTGVGRCQPAGGGLQVLARVESGESAVGATTLPGTDALLFAIARNSDGGDRWDRADIVVQSPGGERRTVLTGGTDPRYVDTGHLLYTSAGVLFAVPFDAAAQTLKGDPVPIIEGIRRSPGVAQLAVAATGVIAYMPGPTGRASGARSLGVADRAGVVTRLPVPEGHYVHVRASRDGRTLAVGSDDGSQAAVWIYRLDGSAALQRLTIEANNRFPIWSPDGVHVAIQSDRGGAPGIYRQRADGVGAAERLTAAAEGETHIPESWSADGRHLSFAVRTSDGYSLSLLTLSTRRVEPVGTVRSLEPPGSVFSPDGKWLAHGSTSTDDITASTRGVFVRSMAPNGGVYQAPRQIIDFHPVWTPDGRELVYTASASSGQMAVVRVNTSAGMSFGAPARFPAAVTGDRLSGEPRAFDILPDGRFVGIVPATGTLSRDSLMEIRVVLNWFDDLRARVRAK